MQEGGEWRFSPLPSTIFVFLALGEFLLLGSLLFVFFSSQAFPDGSGLLLAQQLRHFPLALFSCALFFRHPKTGEALRFDALPEEAWPWTLFSEALRSSAE